MREIEFRGRDKRLDGTWEPWVYGSLDLSDLGPVIHSGITPPANVEPETIGQFIGLRDKHGVKIYEGDVVKCIPIRGRGYYGVIKYVTRNAMFELLTRMEGKLWVLEEYEELEILGNIFDNPQYQEFYGEVYQDET